MIRRHAFCLSLLAVLCWGGPASAQDADTDSETAVPTEAETPTEIPDELLQSRTMEEIEVVVGPQGQSAFELEMQRQAALQEAIFAEARMRERREEELAWRQADPDLQDKESRIKWGYSAQAEQRMRNDMDEMYDLPIDQVKPASVFRIEF
jgi:hypothetical protein